MEKIRRVGFIGSGNVASQLALSLVEKEFEIPIVIGRSARRARMLAKKINSKGSNDFADLKDLDLDLLILAVSDNSIADIVDLVKDYNIPIVHTSGATSIDVLKGNEAGYGVFYPLQTLKKGEYIEFRMIPICVDAHDEELKEALLEVGNRISTKVHEISDEQRIDLHLCAVLMNNNINHLLAKIEDILLAKKLPKGIGDEPSADKRPFQFGDKLEQISMTDSIRNAQINHGIGDFHLLESDLEVIENEYKAQTSTVLMIDISHSMILYGEDRITPAKKVAMALSELIMKKYPKDTLDIIVFGNDAWQISVKDLPYLQVGPYHTNTVAGLELAMDLLRRRKNPNKNIFMITDGKPTCIKEGIEYYKNSFGLDRKILNKTFNLAKQCRRLKIPVTTFMIAKDPYLREFVHDFTEINKGKAFYTSLKGLGEFIFEDYERNKRKRVR